MSDKLKRRILIVLAGVLGLCGVSMVVLAAKGCAYGLVRCAVPVVLLE